MVTYRMMLQPPSVSNGLLKICFRIHFNCYHKMLAKQVIQKRLANMNPRKSREQKCIAENSMFPKYFQRNRYYDLFKLSVLKQFRTIANEKTCD